ncbi:MAG: glycosyltransferase, partial [Pseudomonadota bacterium]
MTGELAGPDFNGGIGTANLGLALELTTAGHAVQILYTRVASGVPHPSAAVFTQNVDQLALSGLTLQALDFTGPWHDWLGKSHAVLSWLSDQQFDAVFFNDTHGAGFASLLAKKTGHRSLRATNMIVVAHSATQWIFDINQQPVANMAALEQIELERRSLELAETVISPSAYLLETYHSYGWALPEESFVHPNILPFSTLPASRQTPLNGPPEELVFFGRLETRKGLWLFCNALDRLKNRLIDTRVTFLGKSVPEDGEPSVLALLERAKSWPFEIRLLTDYDSPT